MTCLGDELSWISMLPENRDGNRFSAFLGSCNSESWGRMARLMVPLKNQWWA